MSRCASRSFAAGAVLLATGVLLSGCSETNSSYFGNTFYDHFSRRETIARGAGDAVATNQVTQMYDPWPRAAANRNISANGAVVEAGIERYRTGRVIPPRGTGTSSAGYGQQAPAAPPAAPAGPAGTP